MPELPEVETMVRGIRNVTGRTIRSVRACRCECRPILIEPGLRSLSARVRETQIETVRRVAKRIVLDLSTGDSMVIEPRMTGLMLLRDPPDVEHLRLEWEFSDDERNSLWFWDRRGLGTVRLYRPDEFAVALGPDRLGPDALTMTEDEWCERCGRSDRNIKAALLDQRFVAGIGNLYASEILHRARISPFATTRRLNRNRIRRLTEATQAILKTAIRYEGSTLSDGTYRNALNQSGRYQNEHRVYMKADTQCSTCHRGRIRRVVQQQRSTFYCPVCQRK